MSAEHEFVVFLTDHYINDTSGPAMIKRDPARIRAFEMDIVDGALMFSGVNRGGYIAGFAAGEWVSVTSECGE
jgi:hypothetical protein